MLVHAVPRCLQALLLLTLAGLGSGCGDRESGAGEQAVGPVIWTVPVQENGSESVTIGDRTVKVGTPRGWETVEVAVEMMGTETLLRVELDERELQDWGVYASALRDQEMVIRIADLDLMILAGGPQLKGKGLWRIGPRETAEPRAQELLRRLAEAPSND